MLGCILACCWLVADSPFGILRRTQYELFAVLGDFESPKRIIESPLNHLLSSKLSPGGVKQISLQSV